MLYGPYPLYSTKEKGTGVDRIIEARSKKADIQRTTTGSSYQQSLRPCTASKICTCIDVKIKRGIETFVLRIASFSCIGVHHNASQPSDFSSLAIAAIARMLPAVFIDFSFLSTHTEICGYWCVRRQRFCDSMGTTGGSSHICLHRVYESVDAWISTRCKDAATP
jgi:hypothetical protein